MHLQLSIDIIVALRHYFAIWAIHKLRANGSVDNGSQSGFDGRVRGLSHSIWLGFCRRRKKKSSTTGLRAFLGSCLEMAGAAGEKL